MATMRQAGLRTSAVIGALLALIVAGLPLDADATDHDVNRIAGDDRFETAAAVSAASFPDADEVSTAYIATGQEFPDALTAGAAAAAIEGPVLLVRRASVPAATRDELRRLGLDEIVIVGGTSAVGQDVEDELAADDDIGAQVRRVEGENRFDTAGQLAVDTFPDGVDTVYIATGLSFADALAGVPAAARVNAPVLLVASASIPPQTRAALDALDPQRAIILGGTGAIRAEVEDELRGLVDETTRVEGGTRFETAVEVSRASFSGARTVYVATGVNFPDALGGGPAAAGAVGPLLLTPGSGLPDVVAEEIARLNPRRAVVLGGTAAIRDAVVDEIHGVLGTGTALAPGAIPDFAFIGTPADINLPLSVRIGTDEGSFEDFSNPVPADIAFDLEPTFSPDGEHLAFTRVPLDDETGMELYVGNVADGAASIRQVSDNLADFGPDCFVTDLAWSPDSTQIAYMCLAFFGEASRVVVADFDGTRQIVGPNEAGTDDFSPTFHPDGEHLTLTRVTSGPGEDEATYELRHIPLDDLSDPGETLYSQDNDLMFDLTWVDDERLAFIEGDILGDSDHPVSILTMSAGDPDLILTGASGDTAQGAHYIDGVTPDGDRLLIRTYRVWEPEQGSSHDQLRLVTIEDDNDQTDLVGLDDLEHGLINRASLSPDGARVLYDDGRGILSDGLLMRINADGTGRTQVDIGDLGASMPTWNPAAFD